MNNNSKYEFETYLKKWTIENNRYTNGIDVGCGTARVSDMITSIDRQPDYRYAHAQFVWDCANLDLFANNVLDFIFSSHCLEDFENIAKVFLAWWSKLKVGGYMLLLLPDMEKCNCEHCKGKSRYPQVGELNGNPSHRSNTGKQYVNNMLTDLVERGLIKYNMKQVDTIPHNTSSSIDFCIQKEK